LLKVNLNYIIFDLIINCFVETCFPCFGRFMGNYIVILYLITKLIYLLNTVLQIYLISVLLGIEIKILKIYRSDSFERTFFLKSYSFIRNIRTISNNLSSYQGKANDNR
jgi:hypothetical protein